MTPVPVQRTPVGDSETLNAIARHLEELKGLVGTQSWQGSSGSVELAAMGTQHVDAEWRALGELRQRLSEDRNGTSRNLYFLTPAMVIQRYGRPTRISPMSNGRLNWIYSSEPGGPQFSVTFRFVDGYVIDVR